jgi:SMI1 / KNR4 family (SUKH-1)
MVELDGFDDFDCRAWVSRAHAFTIGIRSVPAVTVRSTAVSTGATDSDLRRVEHTVGAALPATLQALFVHGSAALDCAYVFEPDGNALERLTSVLPEETRIFGGARFGPVSDLGDYARALRAWATDTWVSDTPEQRVMWESAFPFLSLDNGDFLALDTRAHVDDPSVVYLCHDDDSFALAPNLWGFLSVWERLCYIGPEHWLLRPFMDEKGHLDADSTRAAQLRQLLAH